MHQNLVLLRVFLVKRMKIVLCIYSWFTEAVLIKQYFLLSDFVLSSFHCIYTYIHIYVIAIQWQFAEYMDYTRTRPKGECTYKSILRNAIV